MPSRSDTETCPKCEHTDVMRGIAERHAERAHETMADALRRQSEAIRERDHYKAALETAKRELAEVRRVLNIAANREDYAARAESIAAERDRYKVALQQIIEWEGQPRNPWTLTDIAREALNGDSDE